MLIETPPPDQGGTGDADHRWVTMDIYGARFAAGALVKLSSPGVFEIEPEHTYYVGELGAWVHNTTCEQVQAAGFPIQVNGVASTHSDDGTMRHLLPAMTVALQGGAEQGSELIRKVPEPGMCPVTPQGGTRIRRRSGAASPPAHGG